LPVPHRPESPLWARKIADDFAAKSVDNVRDLRSRRAPGQFFESEKREDPS